MDTKQKEIEEFLSANEIIYCEKFMCKLTKTACEKRRKAHGTMFMFGFKFIKDYGCGGCEQWQKNK